MIEALTIMAVTAGAFVGTNLDNLVLLVGFYARYRNRTATVTAAYIAGMALIACLFFLMGESGDLIPVRYLGILGVIPIIIGGASLVRLLRPQVNDQETGRTGPGDHKAAFLAVLLTQLSNGTDTVITFSVLLADSTDNMDRIVAMAFMAMVLLFSALAKYTCGHPKLGRIVERFGSYVTPFILILVGWYILADTATDLV